MAVLNIGSINWDRVYHVTHFPAAGETISATKAVLGLGGKGLNQSVALLRAGANIRHFGAIGADDDAMRGELDRLGLDLTHISGVEGLTGSALILVDAAGENLIVLDRGANGQLPQDGLAAALGVLRPGDWVLLQNETNMLGGAIAAARALGLRVALAAAPFDATSLVPLLDQVDLLAVNQIEFDQLQAATDALPKAVLVTRGADGAMFRDENATISAPAFAVDPVDTTGAGDTFLGYFLADIDRDATPALAMRSALADAAIQVTRPGAVPAIPTRAEVSAFLADR